MATRVVMVEFNAGVTEADMAEFQRWLEDLAARTPYLIRMQCGPHFLLPEDAKLSENAPDVTFGHFVSVWEFHDEAEVASFLEEPFHKEIAAGGFRKMVRHRYVVNFR